MTTFAGKAGPRGLNPGTQSRTAREVLKPVTPADGDAGTSPQLNSEPSPATIPELSSPADGGTVANKGWFVPQRGVGSGPRSGARLAIVPGPEQWPGGSLKTGPAPRHPRAPNEEQPGASASRIMADERNARPAPGVPPRE